MIKFKPCSRINAGKWIYPSSYCSPKICELIQTNVFNSSHVIRSIITFDLNASLYPLYKELVTTTYGQDN